MTIGNIPCSITDGNAVLGTLRCSVPTGSLGPQEIVVSRYGVLSTEVPRLTFNYINNVAQTAIDFPAVQAKLAVRSAACNFSRCSLSFDADQKPE